MRGLDKMKGKEKRVNKKQEIKRIKDRFGKYQLKAIRKLTLLPIQQH